MIRYGIVLLAAAAAAIAQTAPALEGDWHGTLAAGGTNLRLGLHIEKASDGLFLGKLNSIDQGAVLPLDSVERKGDHVTFTIKAVGGSFDGTLTADKLKGIWTQGGPLPLEFTRDTGGSPAPAKPAEPPKMTTAQMKAFGIPADLHVPVPPTPVLLDGKNHLIYELQITNTGEGPIALKSLEILGDGRKLAAFEGQTFNGLIHREDETGSDKRTIPLGVRAVVFLDVALDKSVAPPAELRHRLAVEDLWTEGGVAAVVKAKPLVLGPPLHGGGWLAANGPSNTSIHRRALLTIDGGYHIAQRFAIDWLRFAEDQKTYSGDPKDNKNYHAYGSEALAVSDGTVVEVKDGIPENIPGLTSRAVPITLETVGGNHVVLDLGGGHYAFYAHLQPGKLRVKTGDKVKRGQVLGLVGNSGNSTEPHLHFHISDGISPLGSEGLPYVLESSGALPAQNAIVTFDKR